MSSQWGESDARAAPAVVAPFVKRVVSEVGAELRRLGTQGGMELASAIFNGHAFVPYGPGQYSPSPQAEPGVHGPQQDAPQPERGGRGR